MAAPREAPLADLARALDLPYLDAVAADPALFALLPVETASSLGLLPLREVEGVLSVAVSDPLDLGLERRLSAITGKRIALSVAEPEAIAAALKQVETSRRVLDRVSASFKPQIVREDGGGKEEVIDLDSLADQSGVVQLTNSVLMAALQRTASDVHIEVYADRLDLKYRIDGVLYPATDPIDVRHHAELVSRIKVMADLDIAERRVPQDGRFRLRIEGRDVDFRVSVLPTQFGEDVVIRILDKSGLARLGQALGLEDLGLEPDDAAAMRRAAREPHGLVLMTGPTGSGKTTTLYGAISELATGAEKIITIEDPIEYQLDGIVQIAVNEKKGMTFASGLRAILRHDPDRIMVGEIRDFETATIAVQAALTGHLVFASVHANSSFDVISRFAHWGIDLHDFVSALNGVFAQRLVRKLCPDCAGPAPAPDTARLGRTVPWPNAVPDWRGPQGCARCFGTGYLGRAAIVEHLDLSPEIADLMIARAPAARMRTAASAQGMRFLRDSALSLAWRGQTSLAEVDRVTFEP